MNREIMSRYISDKLMFLAFQTKQYGKLNLLNIHIHSENFYCILFNLIFSYELKNINMMKSNVEAVDLIDKYNKIIIQVSSTHTKQKIQGTLNNVVMKNYIGYHFKFISLTVIENSIRNKKFSNPYLLEFNPLTDIYDVNSIIRHINTLGIDQIIAINKFIKEELGSIDGGTIVSTLAKVIEILAENPTKITKNIQLNTYEIDRKIKFNELNSFTSELIYDFSLYYGKINNIYDTYSSEGKDIGLLVLNQIKQIFLKNHLKYSNNNALFSEIISETVNLVQNSSNYDSTIDFESLLYSVQIIIVDAFIKCKIFKNPERYMP